MPGRIVPLEAVSFDEESVELMRILKILANHMVKFDEVLSTLQIVNIEQKGGTTLIIHQQFNQELK